MLLRLLCRAALPVAAALLVGCGPEIGDECTSDAQCGQGRICDLQSKDGYCTIVNCSENSCPDNSVCVEFANEETFCMALCDSDRGDGTYVVGRGLEQSWNIEAPLVSGETEGFAVTLEGCRDGYVCDRVAASHPFCRPRSDCESSDDIERHPECAMSMPEA